MRHPTVLSQASLDWTAERGCPHLARGCLLPIPLPHYSNMMRKMSRNDIGQSRTVTRLPLTMPPRAQPSVGTCFGIGKWSRGALAGTPRQAPPNLIRSSVGSRHVMVVAFQGSIEATQKPERAIGEGTPGVGHMTQHLANAPFIRRIAYSDCSSEIELSKGSLSCRSMMATDRHWGPG
jgi:hypothetical protein